MATDQGIAARSWLKSEQRVICKVYLALLILFTSTTAESPIIENLFSVRISSNSNPLIICPWITNKHCSIWSCSGKRNCNSLVSVYTGWSLTSAGVWPGFKVSVHFIFKCIKCDCILKVLTFSRCKWMIVLIPDGVSMPHFCDVWCEVHPRRVNMIECR